MRNPPQTASETSLATPPRPSRYGKKRATVLALVYVAFAAHMIHWKLAGETLAPLELNEVMHALELGVITAGFIFMSAACLSVLFFGRFFCSWGCHILALEDLCAWILGKLHIKPKPIRSRLLLWVPVIAMFYMFMWPQVKRIIVTQWPSMTSVLGQTPEFRLRLLSDGEGWASFVTTDWARNLPGPGIAIITLLLLGFVIVYVLGSRAFCAYGCPYGVIFGFIDRFTPGSIRLNGECAQCGMCTSECTSNIKVHEEIDRFGMVVSPNCLKDLDCVSVCSHGVLKYGWGKPSLFKSWRKKGKKAVRRDLTGKEELLAGVAFVATLVIFRGLYFQVPFLMTLGLGSIMGFGAVTLFRLLGSSDVSLANLKLKTSGSLTGRGHAFLVGAAVLALFSIHSSVIRYHEMKGLSTFGEVRSQLEQGDTDKKLVAECIDHLQFCYRWGIYRSSELDRMLGDIHLQAGHPDQAIPFLERVVASNEHDHQRHFRLARALADVGRMDEAHASYASLLGALPEAASGDEAAMRRKGKIHFNLAVVSNVLGRKKEALTHYGIARDLHPTDPEIQNNFGHLLDEIGRSAEARACFEKAIALKSDFAEPHFNLGRILWRNGQREAARTELLRAVEIEPRYGPHVSALIREGSGSR